MTGRTVQGLVGRALGRALVRAVDRAGTPGGIRFTRRQLYYELCRVLRPLPAVPRRPRFTVPAPVSYGRYLAALDRHGEIDALVDDVGDVGDVGEPSTGGPVTDAPDLFDYGLPRLLVCQDPSIAAMLLANEQHLESACPVFARADLPLDPRLTGALHRAGNATVFVLHDASAAGFAVVREVRAWAGELRVSPLGLRPVHAAALHLTARRADLAGDGSAPADPADSVDAVDPVDRDGLQPWEYRWLRSGRSAEVAAVNPARLLRTVHRLVRNQSRVRRQLPQLRRIQAAGFMTWPDAERAGG